MKKSIKRKATVTLASILAAGMIFTGCGSKPTSDGDKSAGTSSELAGRYAVDANTPAWKLDKKESTTLKWYVNADWWNTTWNEDTVTKKIKQDLKLDVEFITGDDTKLNTLFAGEDLPDIITIFDSHSSVATSANQWALALNDLADKYDPYFYKVAKPDTLKWFQLSDGKTYGYPGYSNSQEDYDKGYIKAATAFTIRKDIYEALGKPSMGTPEEFINVLTQIKQKYNDLLPFGFNSMTNSTGSLGADFQNFIGVPIENNDGTWYDRDMDPDYIKWLKTFNEAYKKGLISDDSFSDDGTAHEDKIKGGRYATVMIGGTPQRSGALQVWMSANPNGAYIAIDGPQSTVGNKPTLSQAGLSGWTVTYITNKCTDPIKAIELYTYLLSDDAGILTTYGVKGETYQVNQDGKYELLPEVGEMKEKDNDRFKKVYRLGEFCLFGHDRYQTNSAYTMPSITQMQQWGDGKLKTQFEIENIDPNQGTAEARSLSTINTKWNTTLVSLIRAKDDATFNKLIDDYKAFRKDNNWDAIMKVRNENIEKNRAKLGTK